MNRKKRTLVEELKKNLLFQPHEEAITNKHADEFQSATEQIYQWNKDLKNNKCKCLFGEKTLSAVDLKRENMNLQRLLNTAEIERDQLKKAISIFSISNHKFTWS